MRLSSELIGPWPQAMRKVITYFDGPETLVGKKPRAPLSIREQSSRRQLSTLFGPPW